MAAYFTLFGQSTEAQPLACGLYIVATPIGNLGDITLRALSTLAAADAILAEDRRVTKILLSHYGIKTPITLYHEHNAEAARPHILEKLTAGARLALVSDAGTPLISDPGYKLVEAAIARDITITALPGASALLAGLVLSGLPSDRFFFEGFLPTKTGERRRRIRALDHIPATLIFYEGPHRLSETLADLAAVLGERRGVMARELTKKFETLRRGSLPDLAAYFAAEAPPRGEIVLLVAPPGAHAVLDDAMIDMALARVLATHSPRDAVQHVAAELGLARRRVYARMLQRGEDEDAS